MSEGSVFKAVGVTSTGSPASWSDEGVRVVLEHPSGASLSVLATKDGRLEFARPLMRLVKATETYAPLPKVEVDVFIESLHQRLPMLANHVGDIRTATKTANVIDDRYNALTRGISSLTKLREEVTAREHLLHPMMFEGVPYGGVALNAVGNYVEAVQRLTTALVDVTHMPFQPSHHQNQEARHDEMPIKVLKQRGEPTKKTTEQAVEHALRSLHEYPNPIIPSFVLERLRKDIASEIEEARRAG